VHTADSWVIMSSCPHRVGHKALMAVVSHVPDPKSRMEGRSQLKISRNEAHDPVDP